VCGRVAASLSAAVVSVAGAESGAGERGRQPYGRLKVDYRVCNLTDGGNILTCACVPGQWHPLRRYPWPGGTSSPPAAQNGVFRH
jgi:hypothetical protein